MKNTRTRNLMAAAVMGTLVLTATSDAAAAQADVSGPASKEGSGDDAAELAKKLQNPVANLISVPIQNNWDFGIGPEDAMRYLVNVQPVIPFSLNQDWNLITRTILPFIHMESPVPDGDDTGGTGDILQSFFFSPKDPVGGWIVGAGPVFLYPSASDDALGSCTGDTAEAQKRRYKATSY